MAQAIQPPVALGLVKSSWTQVDGSVPSVGHRLRHRAHPVSAVRSLNTKDKEVHIMWAAVTTIIS